MSPEYFFSIVGGISRSWVSALDFKASLKRGCRSLDLGPANQIHRASLPAQSVKNLPAVQESTCSAGDLGSIPGSGRSPGEGNGNPLQYSCPENAVNRGAWWATGHGIARVGHGLTTKPPIRFTSGRLCSKRTRRRGVWCLGGPLLVMQAA